MIKTIVLQDFQSHHSSLLEFDPGVNVIIGDSDGGKTAILRALNWVLTNRPTGEAFRRNGSDKTIVTVDTSDGTISRIRSNKDNLYLDGRGEKLAAIGTSVPEPVLKLLKMDPDVNIQRQLDAPFLLSCSPGEVAQRLNAVVGLDDIDVGLSNVTRRVKQNQALFDMRRELCGVLSTQVESFAYLGQMEHDIELLEAQFGNLSSAQLQVDGLVSAMTSIEQCQLVLDALPDVNRFFVQILEAEKQLENYNKVYQELRTLSDLSDSIIVTNAALEDIPNVVDLLSTVRDVEELLRQLQDSGELGQIGLDLIAEHSVVSQDILKITSALMDHEAQFHKQSPAICPLCGRKGKR